MGNFGLLGEHPVQLNTGALINQPLTNGLRFIPGAIVRAEILRLFPNQLAKIRIAGQALTAQLDTPLSAGDKAWLVVASMSRQGLPQLKLLTLETGSFNHNPLPERPALGGQPPLAALEKMLLMMGIKPVKPMLSLVEQMTRHGLPLTQASLRSAEAMLRQSTAPVNKTISAIIVALEADLPLEKGLIQLLTHLTDNGRINLPELARQVDAWAKAMDRLLAKNPESFPVGNRHFEAIKSALSDAATPSDNGRQDRALKAEIQEFLSTKMMVSNHEAGRVASLRENELSTSRLNLKEGFGQTPMHKLQTPVLTDRHAVTAKPGFANASPPADSSLDGMPFPIRQLVEAADKLGLNRQTAGKHQSQEEPEALNLKTLLEHTLASKDNSSLPPDIYGQSKELLQTLQSLQLLAHLTAQSQALNAIWFLFIPLLSHKPVSFMMKNHDPKRKEVDPEHCTILLQIALIQLGKIKIELKLVKRRIRLSVTVEKPSAKPIFEKLLTGLGERLAANAYYLVSGTVRISEKPLEDLSGFQSPGRESVDLKI